MLFEAAYSKNATSSSSAKHIPPTTLHMLHTPSAAMDVSDNYAGKPVMNTSACCRRRPDHSSAVKERLSLIDGATGQINRAAISKLWAQN